MDKEKIGFLSIEGQKTNSLYDVIFKKQQIPTLNYSAATFDLSSKKLISTASVNMSA